MTMQAWGRGRLSASSCRPCRRLWDCPPCDRYWGACFCAGTLLGRPLLSRRTGRPGALGPDARLDIGHLEAQAAGDRVGLGQKQFQLHAALVNGAAVLARQRASGLVIGEIFRAERRDRHQPVTAQILDRRKEAEIEHAGDARVDELADMGRQIGRHIAVHRIAFGLHRTPFGAADDFGDMPQIAGILLGQAGAALDRFIGRRGHLQIIGIDQCPVDQQIGIAPDRRGEMRIAGERQTEMTGLLCAIIGLRLRAQRSVPSPAAAPRRRRRARSVG